MEKQSQDEAATEQQAEESELLSAGERRGPRRGVLAADEDTESQGRAAGQRRTRDQNTQRPRCSPRPPRLPDSPRLFETGLLSAQGTRAKAATSERKVCSAS